MNEITEKLNTLVTSNKHMFEGEFLKEYFEHLMVNVRTIISKHSFGLKMLAYDSVLMHISPDKFYYYVAEFFTKEDNTLDIRSFQEFDLMLKARYVLMKSSNLSEDNLQLLKSLTKPLKKDLLGISRKIILDNNSGGYHLKKDAYIELNERSLMLLLNTPSKYVLDPVLGYTYRDDSDDSEFMW